jgi:hypothetical protein
MPGALQGAAEVRLAFLGLRQLREPAFLALLEASHDVGVCVFAASQGALFAGRCF